MMSGCCGSCGGEAPNHNIDQEKDKNIEQEQESNKAPEQVSEDKKA